MLMTVTGSYGVLTGQSERLPGRLSCTLRSEGQSTV